MNGNHCDWPFFLSKSDCREHSCTQSKFRIQNLGNKGISSSAVRVKFTSGKKKKRKCWWIQELGETYLCSWTRQTFKSKKVNSCWQVWIFWKARGITQHMRQSQWTPVIFGYWWEDTLSRVHDGKVRDAGPPRLCFHTCTLVVHIDHNKSTTPTGKVMA